MQIYDIKTDSSGRELTQHGSEDFPCSQYDEKFSQFVTGEVPWHWHDEIELVYVVEGQTKVEVTQGAEVIGPGDAVFINSGVLHKLTDVGSVDCHILNFVVAPRFFGDSLHGRIYSKYIAPVAKNHNIPMFVFRNDVPWKAEVIEILKTAFSAYQSQMPTYEMKVQQSLSQFWMLLCENKSDILKDSGESSVAEKRLHNALNYVHQNYEKALTVSDIGAAINVSESECFRLFKNKINTTPLQYVLNYRLQIAANLLAGSKEPITQIAHSCGFNSSSYFSKRFSEMFGVTPNGFRKQGGV